jgi:surface antigen
MAAAPARSGHAATGVPRTRGLRTIAPVSLDLNQRILSADFTDAVPAAAAAALSPMTGSMPMTARVRFLLPFALLLAAAPAAAQLLGPLWETNVTLTRADLDTIRATLAQKIHGHPAGTMARWQDPASGNSGKIRLLKVFEQNGERCEQIEYHNYPRDTWRPADRFVLTSCRQPDGAWKLS